MIRRTAVSLSVALVLLAGACGDDDEDATPSGSTAAPATTGQVGTSSTSTTSTSVPATDTTTPIPPVTPPADQPEACRVLAAAAGLDPAVLEVDDQPNGEPAPSTGCRAAAAGVALALFYGQDPLETLALARVQNPVGSDVTGLGQDAYDARGVVYVDTGSRAFAVSGGSRDELVTLAQGVIANL